jgi:hypothetical protein
MDALSQPGRACGAGSQAKFQKKPQEKFPTPVLYLSTQHRLIKTTQEKIKTMRKLITALSFLSAVLAFSAGTTLAAHPQPVDLRVMPWQGPASPMVNSPYQYTVTVKNIGGTAAAGVKVVVDLPLTDTSPSKYILGKLTGIDPQKCQVLSNKLQCNLTSLSVNQTKSFTFNFELPVSTKTLTFKATASTTTTGETALANNQLSLTPTPAHGNRPITSATVLVSHCTGTGLSSYFECELFPSSIASFVATLDGDLTINHVTYGNLGYWDQFASTQGLHMQLIGEGSIAEFNGFSTGGNCFEGMTTFGPGTSYVSPYKVCIQ